jgi:glycosyltransferase involved in cell wall biosynthesis
MRVGWNPLKRMERQDAPRRVIVATMTHVPFLAGFYAQALDVLQLMFASLRDNTPEEHGLFVFDNGSCDAAREFLLERQRQGEIDFLLLSRENLGYLRAMNIIFPAAPGEFIAYTDSDVYFYPGWLEACLRVIETFPNVGLVTGTPVRSSAADATRSALAWAARDAEVQLDSGQLVPKEWVAGYCEGTGRDLERYLAEWQGLPDHRLTYHGVSAYTGASSFHFVARKSTILEGLPMRVGRLMEGPREMMDRLDDAGYSNLAVDGCFVHHLGNTLPPKWREVAQRHGLQPESQPLSSDHSWSSRLGRVSLVRRVLIRLYDGLFHVLYRGGLS